MELKSLIDVLVIQMCLSAEKWLMDLKSSLNFCVNDFE